VFSASVQVAQGVQGRKGGVEDEQRVGCSSPSGTENNVARVKAVLDMDRLLTMRVKAVEVRTVQTDGHRISKEDLHVRKICAKLVWKNFSDEQKDSRVFVTVEILDLVPSEPDFLQRVISED
jgi:hypothetical protein